MKLLNIIEPIFIYICDFNRIVRSGSRPMLNKVQADIKELRDNANIAVAADSSLRDSYDKIELPLVFFIDYMIEQAGFREWEENRIAVNEFGRRAGNDEFFDYLTNAEGETGDPADERLAFYYTCLGLGFLGMYEDVPDEVQKIMTRLEPRVRPYIDRQLSAKITPDNYKHTNTEELSYEASSGYLGLILFSVCMLIAVFVTVSILYSSSKSELTDAIKTINAYEETE